VTAGVARDVRAAGLVPGLVSCPVPNGAAVLRLLCFPHAGNGPASFRGWAQALAPDVEVWTVSLPGRAGRPDEPPAREWEPLVHGLARAVGEAIEPPYALFGHSLGALLAFEVARRLSRGGDGGPAHLVVSARGGPDVVQTFDVPVGDRDLLARLEVRYGQLPSLIRDEEEVLALFLPALRADLELVDAYAYRPGPALRCPITAISGEDDDTVTAEQVGRWARQTTADFAAHRLPAGHFYPPEQAGTVFDILRRRLLPVRAGATARGSV
jgi:surfactin synthase thioesterase subunit